MYKLSALKRSIVVWSMFQLLLWTMFVVSYFIHNDAWTNVAAIGPIYKTYGNLGSTILFIAGNNLFICLIIVCGNLIARFKSITPGLLVMIIQGVTIGWLAGRNGFEVPFNSVLEANLQFLKIGLWETTAYAIFCGVTISKSLNISDTFPAKKWSKTLTFDEIKLNKSEWTLILLACVMIFSSAIIEANYLVRI